MAALPMENPISQQNGCIDICSLIIPAFANIEPIPYPTSALRTSIRRLSLNITPSLYSHITYAFSPDAATRRAHEHSEGELVRLTAGYRSLLAARPKGVHLPPWHTGQSRLGLNCISKTMPHLLQT
jgi:hypothetical protein